MMLRRPNAPFLHRHAEREAGDEIHKDPHSLSRGPHSLSRPLTNEDEATKGGREIRMGLGMLLCCGMGKADQIAVSVDSWQQGMVYA